MLWVTGLPPPGPYRGAQFVGPGYRALTRCTHSGPVIRLAWEWHCRWLNASLGSIARPAFRMAIGQLADYARQVEPTPQRAILVPQKPRPDLLRLAESENLTVIWPEDDGFKFAA